MVRARLLVGWFVEWLDRSFTRSLVTFARRWLSLRLACRIARPMARCTTLRFARRITRYVRFHYASLAVLLVGSIGASHVTSARRGFPDGWHSVLLVGRLGGWLVGSLAGWRITPARRQLSRRFAPLIARCPLSHGSCAVLLVGWLAGWLITSARRQLTRRFACHVAQWMARWIARRITHYFHSSTAFPVDRVPYYSSDGSSDHSPDRVSDGTSAHSWVHSFHPFVYSFTDVSRAVVHVGWRV